MARKRGIQKDKLVATDKFTKNLYYNFCITVGDDIIWRYSLLESDSTYTLVMKWFSTVILEAGGDMHVIYPSDNPEQPNPLRQDLKFIESVGKDRWQFVKVGDPRAMSDSDTLTIGYNATIKINLISDVEYIKYLQKSYYKNIQEKSSSKQRMIDSILHGNEDNKEIARFMLDINTKLDKILDAISNGNEQDGCSVEIVGINAHKLIVHSTTSLPEGSKGYMDINIGYHDDRFSFASVVSINELKRSTVGAFYNLYFDEMANDVQDKIVRFLFIREREMIKEIRELENKNLSTY